MFSTDPAALNPEVPTSKPTTDAESKIMIHTHWNNILF